MDNLQSVECEGALQAALSPDGSLICLARVGANGAAVVKTSSAFVAEIEGTAQHSVAAASWSHDGLRVACGGAAPAPPPGTAPPAPRLGFVTCSTALTGARSFATQRPAPVLSLEFSPDDTKLALARTDGFVEVLDGNTGDILQRLRLRGFEELYDHRAPFAGCTPDRPIPPRPPTTPTPCVGVVWTPNSGKLVVARASEATICDLNMAPCAPFGNPEASLQERQMEDEAADDKQTVTRSLKLSCGSSARSVATTTTVGQTQQHFVAVCGGSRVVLAQLNELAIEVNGDIVLDRALTDGQKPWVSACAVAFCSGIRLVVGGELAEAQGAVAIFDCSNGNPLSTHRARAPVLSLSVSADGKTMAVGEKRTAPPPQPTVAEAPAPAPKDPKMFQFGSQENLQAPAAPVPVEDEGPNLLKLVLDQHAQKLKKILEDEFSSIAAAAAIAPAPAPDAMDTSSDQPSQPAAQQALERAKTKVAETCERHQEMVLQLFHAERMVLEWRAHGFMQAGNEGEEDPSAAPAPPAPAPAPAQQ